jgi:microcystin-dependent protein
MSTEGNAGHADCSRAQSKIANGAAVQRQPGRNFKTASYPFTRTPAATFALPARPFPLLFKRRSAMEPFIGQIIMFGGNFAPRSWAFCDGQLLAISENEALFSILGTTFGGDGRTTFGLPDLRGRAPVHGGNGPGLSNVRLGEKGGTETVTLNTSQMPQHTHSLNASSLDATSPNPTGNVLARAEAESLYVDIPTNTTMNSNSINNTGGTQSHNNMQPFQCINFIIALQGTFPSRN